MICLEASAMGHMVSLMNKPASTPVKMSDTPCQGSKKSLVSDVYWILMINHALEFRVNRLYGHLRMVP